MNNLDLLYGDELVINKNITIKHPTVMDIKKLGYEIYSTYVYLLTARPVDVGDILWVDCKIWYEDVTQWEMFLNFFQNHPDTKKAIKWFTGLECEIAIVDNVTYLYCKEKEIYMNEHFYLEMREYIKTINYIPTPKLDVENSGNKITQKYILEHKRKERKNKEEEIIDLSSIISSLIWKGHIGLEVWEFPIYSIYDGYFRLNMIDNYDKTITALYAGNIDTKKTQIDIEKINWSNIIRF